MGDKTVRPVIGGFGRFGSSGSIKLARSILLLDIIDRRTGSLNNVMGVSENEE